ncbi:unnamed protein product [Dracunculus medinensis]|uniref:RNA-directed DNA polymerase from mobile element jockey-like n=1 Tax=Dracunculus medinensis TaxID=318479 RepID=A0A0N4UN87_DRAME|nr:unnamed protein product [Dracunculus medinensis]
MVTREPPIAKTIHYWKNIWEKQKIHNISAKWLQDLRISHNLPDNQRPAVDIERLKNIKSWVSPCPNMKHDLLAKKANSIHEPLAT